MTYEEFIIETTTLEEFYNKEFNNTQKQIWYEELKRYVAEKYNKAIRIACRDNQYRPTLSEMLNIIKAVKLDNIAQEKTGNCKACNNTGYVIYKKQVDGKTYDYACLCTCINATGLEYNGLQVNEQEHRQPFYLAKAQDIFGDKIYRFNEKNMENIQKNTQKLIAN